jgi:hypothetical protein
MDDEKIEMLLDSDLYKFTGAIEHWLTTYHREFWGLKQSYEEDWKNQLGVGDVIVIHASGSEYLEDVPASEANDLTTGIIGIAVVGSLEKKDRPVWLKDRGTGNGLSLLTSRRSTGSEIQNLSRINLSVRKATENSWRS